MLLQAVTIPAVLLHVGPILNAMSARMALPYVGASPISFLYATPSKVANPNVKETENVQVITAAVTPNVRVCVSKEPVVATQTVLPATTGQLALVLETIKATHISVAEGQHHLPQNLSFGKLLTPAPLTLAVSMLIAQSAVNDPYARAP